MEQLFKYFDAYSPLSPAARVAIEKVCTFTTLKKNAELQAVGKVCRTIYFLKKGIARIHYFKEGNDITESFAFENNIIARAESLFTGKPSTKAIQVIEDTEIIAINAPALFKLYDHFHEIERLFRLIVEAAYVDTVNRIESIQFHTADERYRDLVKQAPDLLKRVPLKYIASYLGITQVSLSRIRAQQ